MGASLAVDQLRRHVLRRSAAHGHSLQQAGGLLRDYIRDHGLEKTRTNRISDRWSRWCQCRSRGAWRILLEVDGMVQRGPFNKLSELRNFFVNPFIRDRFEEALTGAGGRLSLSALVVQHIRHTTRILLVFNPIQILSNSHFTDPPFHAALLEAGILTVLPPLIHTLALPPFDSANLAWQHCFEECFNALIRLLTTPPVHKWIIECLRGGLLATILACEQRQSFLEINQFLVVLLALLSSHLTYLSLLVPLHISQRVRSWRRRRSLSGHGRIHALRSFLHPCPKAPPSSVNLRQ